jgi:hypothetical protein
MTGILTLLIPFVLLGCQAPAGQPEPQANHFQLSRAEIAEGWKMILDGKTTTGWRGFKMDHAPTGWSVKNGDLVYTPGSEGGDIMTVDEYGDFELRLEWKIEPAGNSGIMYRVSEKYDAPWQTGPEMQVLDDAGHPDGHSPFTSAGSAYAVYAPSKKVVKAANQFNEVRIICKGNHVEHWLNGVKIVEYELGGDDWKAKVAASKFKDSPDYGKMTKGHIVLQDHGNLVTYRNIRIKKL